MTGPDPLTPVLQSGIPPVVKSVGTTMVTSVLYSMAAYSHKWKKEKFMWQKVLRTMLIGVMVGLVAVYFGFEITPEKVTSIAGTFGLVAIADHLSKTIINYVRENTGV